MQRERLTITLDGELVQAIDGLVDKSTLRNRSHAIEHLLKEGIGLHELKQAFLFFQAGWEQAQLEQSLKLCQNQGINHLYLCLASNAQPGQVEVESMVRHILPDNTPALQSLPADFGSGAAILLQKTQLDHPFALIWVGPSLQLPPSLTGAYLFHRGHRAPLTQILTSNNGQDYHFTGLALAQPELLHHIPPGMVSLEETVFPVLVKEAKVKGYAT